MTATRITTTPAPIAPPTQPATGTLCLDRLDDLACQLEQGHDGFHEHWTHIAHTTWRRA